MIDQIVKSVVDMDGLMNNAYMEVHELLYKKATSLCLKNAVIRDHELVGVNEIYARLKLSVCAKLLEECHDWTLRHYNK